ncbi:MAG: SGNH/GDSL hydrolase family protein [Clostridia bacterium]|nr:SGNH/GDSL hydrolase family protein [Clostridia bacterium]
MNKDSIIKILLIVIIVLLIGNIALLAVWGVVSIATGTPLFDGTRPTDTEKDTQADTSDLPVSGTPDTSVVLGESADMGQEYIDSIIFLGDSTTYHMVSRGVLSGGKETKQVWSGVDENGEPSGTLTLDSMIHKTTIYHPLDGKEKTIAQAVAQEKPKYMVITLGVNGVAYLNETQFKAYYGKLIDAIMQASPETKIILQSIFPVTAAYDQKGGKLCNANIDVANTWVMQLAKEKGCKYSDTASVLKNGSGTMIESYDNGDGIHMTAEAYRAILQYIRTHGYTE